MFYLLTDMHRKHANQRYSGQRSALERVQCQTCAHSNKDHHAPTTTEVKASNPRNASKSCRHPINQYL